MALRVKLISAAVLSGMFLLAHTERAHANQVTTKGVTWHWYNASSITWTRSYPQRVNLSTDAPPVGNQDPTNRGINSCAAWVAAEYRYWIESRLHGVKHAPGFAPMYTYTRLNGGDYHTTTDIGDNFFYYVAQGSYPVNRYPALSTHGGWWDARWNYWSQAPRTDHFRLSGYAFIHNDEGTAFTDEIKALFAARYPVILVIPSYNDIAHVSAPNYLVQAPADNQVSGTAHAVFATRYDDQGVWFENTYGTTYGKQGWAELSWGYIAERVTDLYWAWKKPGRDIFLKHAESAKGALAAEAVKLRKFRVWSLSARAAGRGISEDGVTSARPSVARLMEALPRHKKVMRPPACVSHRGESQPTARRRSVASGTGWAPGHWRALRARPLS